MARIRPVFCGNFEYDARQSEIERMFTSYGKVDRVDMKTGTFLFSLSLRSYFCASAGFRLSFSPLVWFSYDMMPSFFWERSCVCRVFFSCRFLSP
jgi:hypothetical protein